jgi:hypothetical protein
MILYPNHIWFMKLTIKLDVVTKEVVHFDLLLMDLSNGLANILIHIVLTWGMGLGH